MRIEALDASLAGLPVQLLPEMLPWWDQAAVASGLPEELAIGAVGAPVQPARKSKIRQASTPGREIDLHTVTRMLQLNRNKLRILKLLRREDWIKILHLLPKELLVNALRLFSKNRLLRLLMMLLPKRMLLKLLLQIFKVEDLIKKMPTAELMRILRSPRLRNGDLVKGLQKMDPEFVRLLLVRIYGNYDYSHLKQYELMRIFMHTNKERMMEAFKTLPFKVLAPFVLGFVKKDPELLLLMSDAFIFKLLDKVTKPTLMKACMILPPELLIKILCQLPNQMLMIAAAQIDAKALEEYLISKHPSLLRLLAGAA